jgi:uncharacterized protein (DUF427 family)
MQALYQSKVIADSNDVVTVDGDHYFPRASVDARLLLSSNHRSRHGQYGDETWYSLLVDGNMLPEAAWAYLNPMEAGEALRDRIAFTRGVSLRTGDT